MHLRYLFAMRAARSRLSLQTKTTALVLAVCLIVVGLDVVNLWLERSGDIAHSRESTANLARSIARHAEDTILAVDGTLVELVERLERDGSNAAALERLRSVLRGQMAVLPQLDGLTASDAYGTLIVTSQPTMLKISVADRDYFQFQRDHRDAGPYLGAPVKSRVTGHWII